MKKQLGMLLALGLGVSSLFQLPVMAEEALADTQEITFVLSNEPDGIDPNVTNNSFAVPFLINCFEGLVTYDANGEVVPGNADPPSPN